MRPDPVLVWAAVLAAACLLGRTLGDVQVVVATAVVGAVLVALVALLRKRSSARLVVLVAVALVGIAGSSMRTHLVDTGPLADRARLGGAFGFRLVVVTEPRVGEHGWWAVGRITLVDGHPTRERALIRREAEPPVLGSVWTGRGTARPLNVDGFERYVRSLHAGVALDLRDWTPAGRPGVLERTTERIRERVRTSFGGALPRARAGLAVGLVTGDTRQLPQENEEEMRATGLTHLVAVSGSNVAIVAVGAMLLAAGVGAGARGRRWLVAVVIVWFAVLTRFEPSVIRAVVMALFLLIGQARGVIVDPVRSLGAAVIVLLLLDPLLAGSLGLVLSAVATVGVLVLAPFVRRRLGFLPGRVGELLAVTLGAQIAVAPVLLATQGEVPLSSVPANMVAVPAAAVASVFAGLAAAAAQAHPVLGQGLVRLAEPALAAILWVAEHGEGRLGVLALTRPAGVVGFAALSIWLLAARGSVLARRAAAVTVLVATVVLVPVVGTRGPVRTLTVTAIDVGQGDAILVRSPAATVLVDGGEDDRAAAWLRRHGHRTIDLVAVSHPHADHVGGLPEVLRQSRVGSLWHHPVPFGSEPMRSTLELARAQGTAIHEPRAGQHARVRDLDVDVLGPPPGRPYVWSPSEPNDTSLVLRVRWGSRIVLLTGDAELAAQEDLLARASDLRAGVLKVPHHGAGTTLPEFLRATQAQVAVISVGADNRYGHPHPDVLRTLRTAGMEVRRTDREGTLQVEVPPVHGDLRALVRHPPAVASTHAHRLPHRWLGGAPGASVARGASRRAPQRGPRPRRRDRGRPRGRSPPRDADRVVVRRPESGRPAGRRGSGG